jgi:hypothetical protein
MSGAIQKAACDSAVRNGSCTHWHLAKGVTDRKIVHLEDIADIEDLQHVGSAKHVRSLCHIQLLHMQLMGLQRNETVMARCYISGIDRWLCNARKI